jgi:cytochrome c biogenesis protein CcmG, thiol:disulfide interchange protein DsbE
MSEYRDEPVYTAEAPPDPLPAAEPTMRKPRRTLIGPFTARQVRIVNAVALGSPLVLFVATRPLGGAGPTPAVDPGATFYQISAETQGLELGQRAPELTGDDGGKSTQLMDLDGRAVSLAFLNGRPVWINFWATWCPPCQRETPVLRDAYQAHKADGLVLLSIDVQEDAESVRRYVATYGLTQTIGLDVTGAVFRTYRIFGLPSHYFIDRDGVIPGRYFGPLTPALVEQQLKVILAR